MKAKLILYFFDFSTIFFEFSKFNSKRNDTITDRSLEQFKSSQTGPWPKSKGKGKVDRPSLTALVRGEGRGGSGAQGAP
jgi:hypothetical protein